MCSDPQNPLAPRIHQYIERMLRSKTEIFDEASRKRGPPEPIDGLDAAKRQKLVAQVAPAPVPRIHVPPLTPGPHTIAELFTVTNDSTLKNFDVAILGEDMVVNLCIHVLKKVSPDTLNQTIDVSKPASMQSFNCVTHTLLSWIPRLTMFRASGGDMTVLRLLHLKISRH